MQYYDCDLSCYDCDGGDCLLDGKCVCDENSNVLDECGVCGGDNSTCTGCMNDTACNYNDCNGDEVLDDPCTIEDNQLCSYPEEVYLNCDGSCINDSDGDGVCDVCYWHFRVDYYNLNPSSFICSQDDDPIVDYDEWGICRVPGTFGYDCRDCLMGGYIWQNNYPSGDVVVKLFGYSQGDSFLSPDYIDTYCDPTMVAAGCLDTDSTTKAYCGRTPQPCQCPTDQVIVGCTDETACNYDSTATDDDDSCEYPEDFGWCDCAGNVVDCAGECGGDAILDDCGECGGEGIPEGECDCDGNIDLGCGCGITASINYCIDTDTDSLGAGDSTYYCLADLPTGWVEDCSDLEPDCATNDTDECGECGGDGPAEGFDCNGGSLSLLNGLIPQDYSIHSVYPNPFNPITKITYGLPENTDTQITVFDIGGTHITTLVNTFQIAGYHTINWNASSYPSGVYLIRMDSGDFTQTQKVVLVK